MKRPLWLGAGVAIGVSGTLWAELRLRRWARRGLAALGPALTAGDAVPRGRGRPGRPARGFDRVPQGSPARLPVRRTPAGSPGSLGPALRRAAARHAMRTASKLARTAVRATLAPERVV